MNIRFVPLLGSLSASVNCGKDSESEHGYICLSQEHSVSAPFANFEFPH